MNKNKAYYKPYENGIKQNKIAQSETLNSAKANQTVQKGT
jgi:hypothetical protein